MADSIGSFTPAAKPRVRKTVEDMLNPSSAQPQSGDISSYLIPYAAPSSGTATQVGAGGPGGTGTGSAAGATTDYIGNQFLDNPASAVNNIMQGLGLSVSNNSPFYNAMSQLAPGLEWLQYFTNGTGDPGSFLGNVGGWMGHGTGQAASAPFTGLGAGLHNLLSGGNTADLSSMLDNMNPQNIMQAVLSMIETGSYGSKGSRVRQGLEARAADMYNQFLGQQPTIEAGLGQGQTIADAFLKFLNSGNLLGQLGF